MKKLVAGLILMVFMLAGILPLQEIYAGEDQVKSENAVITTEMMGAGISQESTRVEENPLLTEENKSASMVENLSPTTDSDVNEVNKATEQAALSKAASMRSAISPRSQSVARDVSHLVTSLRVQPREVYDGGDVSVHFDFSEGVENIQAGDVIKISWPSTSGGEVFFEGYQIRKMLSVQNKEVATLEVTPTGATITFNSNVNRLEDVKGWGEFTAKARNLTDTHEASSKVGTFVVGSHRADVTVKKGEAGVTSSFYYKSGDIQAADSDKVRWFLNINNTQVDVEEGIDVIDDIQEGQSLLTDSFDITVRGKAPQSAEGVKSYNGIHAIRDFEAAYPGATIKINANLNHLEVFIPQQYARFNAIVILYKTKITNPNLKELKNNSNITYKEYNKERVYQKPYNVSVKNVFADGGVTGAVKGELKVHKMLETSSVGIPGVQFELLRQDGQEITGEVNGESVRGQKIILTTDENGVLNIKKLAETTYLLKEIHAPQWIDFEPTKAQTHTFEMKPNETTGVEFSVVNKRKTTNIEVTKKWVGTTDVPPTTYVRLYRDGQPLEDEEGAKIIPLPPDKTSYKWKNLPVSDEKGTIFHYEVKEVNKDGTMIAENEGEIAIQEDIYKVSYEDDQKENEADDKMAPRDNIHVTITNTKVAPPKTTHVKVTKKWMGASISKPVTFFRLYRDNQVPEGDQGQIVALKDGKTEYEWTNLPIATADGHLYQYTVKEVSEDGSAVFGENQIVTLAEERYRVHYDEEKIEDDTSHVMITNTKLTSVRVTKKWEGISGKKPSIQVQLFDKNGKTIPEDKGNPVTLEDRLTYEWTDLPVVDENMQPFEYDVREVDVQNGMITLDSAIYRVTTTGNATQDVVITNSRLTQIEVTKKWEGVESTEAPAIQVYLIKNGKKTDSSVTLDEKNQWHAVFELLPVEENGKMVQYDVVEEVPQGYTMSKEGNAKGGFIITNKKQAPPVVPNVPQTKIEVAKKWRGIAADKAPEVTIYLLKNGVRTGEKVVLNSENHWQAIFDNLPKTENDKIIEYDVEEIVPKGYTAKKSGDMNQGFTITNTKKQPTKRLEPQKTTVTVEKVWKGIAADKAPEVTVYLLKNGVRTEEKVVLNSENHWQAIFDNLPKMENDKINEYDVEEVVPKGYTAKKTGNAEQGFIITNTKDKDQPKKPMESQKTTIKVEKVWRGIAVDKAPEVTIYLLKNGVRTGEKVVLNSENHWQAIFDKLPKTENDKIIEYDVEEVVPEGYTMSKEGDVEKGFTITNKKLEKQPKIEEKKEPAPPNTQAKISTPKGKVIPESRYIPKTGDGQIFFGWVGLLLVAGIVMLFFRQKIKR